MQDLQDRIISITIIMFLAGLALCVVSTGFYIGAQAYLSLKNGGASKTTIDARVQLGPKR